MIFFNLDGLAESMGKAQAYRTAARIRKEVNSMISRTRHKYDLDGRCIETLTDTLPPETPPAGWSLVTAPTIAPGCYCPSCAPFTRSDTIKVDTDPLLYNGAQTKIYDTDNGWNPEPKSDTVRSTYRELSLYEQSQLKLVKAAGQTLIDGFKQFQKAEGMTARPAVRVRYMDTAIQRAEEAVMWATKAMTT